MPVKSFYYRYDNAAKKYFTRVDGADVELTGPQWSPLQFAREFNPFKEDVDLFGSCLYLSDTVASQTAFYCLQIASNYAMVRVSFAPSFSAGGIEEVPGGCLRLLAADKLLEENGIAEGGLRSFGVTLYYAPTH